MTLRHTKIIRRPKNEPLLQHHQCYFLTRSSADYTLTSNTTKTTAHWRMSCRILTNSSESGCL